MNDRRNTPSIKICGFRDEATIASMNGLPITEVGLVFAPSKRQVSIELGASLAAQIGQLSCRNGIPPRAAGVFVNMELSSLHKLLTQVPLQIVQLHGQETIDYYEELKSRHPMLDIWKVISVKAEVDQSLRKSESELKIDGQDEYSNYVKLLMQQLEPFVPYIEAILLDAPGGGSGKPFNWKAIAAYGEAANHLGIQIIVAGGLHEANVGQLLEQYAINGVDVSSGVETDGVKDIDKIKQFVRKVIEA